MIDDIQAFSKDHVYCLWMADGICDNLDIYNHHGLKEI